MEKIYEVNYIDLSDDEKHDFMGNFSKIATVSFDEQPLEISWLAQLLIFNRSWNSYQYMDASNGTPSIILLAIQMLWYYLDNKVNFD